MRQPRLTRLALLLSAVCLIFAATGLSGNAATNTQCNAATGTCATATASISINCQVVNATYECQGFATIGGEGENPSAPGYVAWHGKAACGGDCAAPDQNAGDQLAWQSGSSAGSSTTFVFPKVSKPAGQCIVYRVSAEAESVANVIGPAAENTTAKADEDQLVNCLQPPVKLTPSPVPMPSPIQPSAVPVPSSVQPSAVPMPSPIQPSAVPVPSSIQPSPLPTASLYAP